jgi:hypothetical protein
VELLSQAEVWGLRALLIGVLVALYGVALLLGAGPVILASWFFAPRPPAEAPGANDAPFWCWQAVVAYVVVLVIAARVLTFLAFDLHKYPVPFLVYALSLALGLTLWDRRKRSRRHRSDALKQLKETP